MLIPIPEVIQLHHVVLGQRVFVQVVPLGSGRHCVGRVVLDVAVLVDRVFFAVLDLRNEAGLRQF